MNSEMPRNFVDACTGLYRHYDRHTVTYHGIRVLLVFYVRDLKVRFGVFLVSLLLSFVTICFCYCYLLLFRGY